MKINPQIYREYDIRGIVEKDLTPEIVRRLGQGYGTHMAKLGRKNLAVGRDGRLSSKAFQETLVEGLTSTGCNVVDIGVCPAPVYYFSIFHLDKEGGMMVTGSHNPPEFNRTQTGAPVREAHERGWRREALDLETLGGAVCSILPAT